jgi:UDP-2,3-diacylglucosamine hydrolase
MKIIFISDAHLKKRDTKSYKSLMAFLDTLKGRENGNGKRNATGGDVKKCIGNIKGVDDLYILGDLFDLWFSEDAIIYPEYRAAVEKLLELKDQGIRIHICEGNHDFFLADYFAGQLGVEVIKDWAAIDLEGRRTLISHGDTVDERNRRYLLLRRFLRSSFVYKLQRVLPVSFLWKVAQISSKLSKELTAETADALAEKMRRFSLRKFRDGFDAVILGHCHKHFIEDRVVNGNRKTFAILGDWNRHRSYLCYEDGAFTLSSFQAPNSDKQDKR